MITPLIVAAAFIVIGVVLVRSAQRAKSSEEAETDEHGNLHQQKEPVLFWMFVVAQVGFGFLFIVAGCLLGVAAIFEWSK